jgi:hypothetical protein
VPDEPAPFDTRFSLPACDDPPSTEAGVVVLGFSAKQLLAGLGLATLADDPGAVATVIDQVWHAGSASLAADHLVAIGLDRWRRVRPALDALGPQGRRATALRRAWDDAFAALSQSDIGATGPAAAVFLTACWLRAEEIGAEAVSEIRAN